MSHSPVVATLVVTFNRKDLLRECLRANLSQDRPPESLILVDNASTDGTAEMLADEGWLADARIRYRRMDSNLGGAGGFRVGLEVALAEGAEWVWLMDDDAIPESDALRRLVERVDQTESPPLLASAVVTADGRLDVAHRSRVRHRPLRTWHVPARAYLRESFAADAVSFVGPLIHRLHAQACGLPCADYFVYYDDVDFTYRVRRAGFEVRVIPASRIRHLDQGRASRKAMAEPGWGWRMYYRVRNRVHWYRSIDREAWSLWPWLLSMLAVQWGLVLLRQPHKVRRTRLLIRAIVDGWRGRLGKTIDPQLYRE